MQDSPLSAARTARGWTQAATASKLRVSKSYLSKLEAGVERPSLRLFLEIEALFGRAITAEQLLAPADAALLATHRRLAAAQPAEAAA